MSIPPSPKVLLEEAIKTGDITLFERMIDVIKEPKAMLQEYMHAWNNNKLLSNNEKLHAIVKMLQVLRKRSIDLDLSTLPEPALSTIIRQLFLLKPSDAEWILNNMKHMPAIQIDIQSSGWWDVSSIKPEVHIFDIKESTAMYECMCKVLSSGGTVAFEEEITNHFIQADSSYAVLVALQQNMPLEKLYHSILTHDSKHCLEELITHINSLNIQFKGVPLKQEAAKERDEHLAFQPDKMLKQAIELHAFKSISMILDSYHFSEILLKPFIQKAALDNDLMMVLALCKNDFNQAAKYLLNESLLLKDNQSQLYDHFITMLRFSPIEMVDKMMNAYLSNNAQYRELLLQCYSTARHDFMEYAPTFSRYQDAKAFVTFNKFYGRHTPIDLTAKAKADMSYGQERSELVDGFVRELRIPTAKETFIPIRPELLALKTSSSGSRTFATLLERIGKYNFEKNQQNGNFYILNDTHNYETPAEQHYRWAKPLISAVLYHSQSKQLIRYPHQENERLYSLTYENSIINNIALSIDRGGPYVAWQHGRLPLASTIVDIENLLDKMKEQPLKTPEQLTQFYANAAQLAWLIGNTQPLRRGSGTVAELTLKTIFELRDLKAPILKPEFPQLDVLDISFPMDDYIKLFPYFCEPSSLPEHLRKPSLSHLSVGEQIGVFYNEINKVPLIAQEVPRKQSSTAPRVPPPPPSVIMSANIRASKSDKRNKKPPPPPPVQKTPLTP